MSLTRQAKGNLLVKSFQKFSTNQDRKYSLLSNRSIFLSSIKVNGGSTNKNNKIKVFKHNDEPNPEDGYGISKFEAEKALFLS